MFYQSFMAQMKIIIILWSQNIYRMAQYINSNGSINDKMNPTIKSKIIFGVAATMKRLHRNNIIHRKLLPYYVYFEKFM